VTPTVAITGATGFLGLHLVKTLAGEGANIRILARRNPAHEFWTGLDFETIYGSLEQPETLAQLVRGADVVIHAAGLIKAPNLATFLQANRNGARAVAIAARLHAPAAQFIHVSTLAAREPHISEYAFSKHAGEEAVRSVYMDAEEQLTVIRPPVLYGPWDKATLVIFKAAALPFTPVLSHGRASVLHVTDAATALAQLALGDPQPGLFALPGGNYSHDEIMIEAARAQGLSARLFRIPAPIVRTAGTISGLFGKAPIFTAGKARELLHPDWVVHPREALSYVPKIGIAEGFRETVAWYRSENWL
jgi:nucleoside-diphosphate-sugar epimerase